MEAQFHYPIRLRADELDIPAILLKERAAFFKGLLYPLTQGGFAHCASRLISIWGFAAPVNALMLILAAISRVI